MDEAKAEAVAMVKETRRLALQLHTMGVPYQDEAASLYRIAEYIERVMGLRHRSRAVLQVGDRSIGRR